jgi:anaerobic magnesium-protoporphyrin IX monomethyl ester cyclase
MKVMLIVSQVNFCEPMGAMQLASVLIHSGHEVELAVIREEDVAAKTRSFAPDIIGVSCMSPEITPCLEVCRTLKRDGHFILMGGPHPTFFPEVVEEDCVDAVCVGEGEKAILDVLDRRSKGESVQGLPNILTSIHDELILGPLVKDLDQLPVLNRELVYRYPSFKHYALRSFYTSRGCLYNCTYCFNAGYKKIYKNKGPIHRRRKPEKIIQEILQVRDKYSMRFIRFSDDTFIYRLDEWMNTFLDLYRKEVGLPFYCLLRADNVTPEMARALKNAGCHSVSMSIESGDENIRRVILKRRVSNEKIIEAVNLLQGEGILVQSACMLALPETTLEDDIKTIDLAIESRVFMPGFGTFMPYPGTVLGKLCRDRGYYQGDLDKCFSYQQVSPLSCFTDKDKHARYNLMLLATLACKFPWLKNLVVKRLIHYKFHKIYYFPHWLCNGYLARRVFYPNIKISDFIRMFKLYLTFYRKSLIKHVETNTIQDRQ